uniref:EGF-like domain-containing protein n=1 Tax=Plectus sambesii TaxID=2011161 RepID=A0A914VIG8_9BILA
MSAYMASYNGKGCCVEFGTVSIKNTATGHTMTCQCNPGSGDSCYLEFDMDDTTEFQNKINGNGTYNLITSAEISCDKGGRNVLQSNGKSFSIYACYSYSHLMTTIIAASWSMCSSTTAGVLTTKCSETIRQITEQEMSTYIASYGSTSVVGCCVEFGTVSIRKTDTGPTMTCQCNPGSGDSCYLEFDMDDTTDFHNSINGDGTYDLITSGEIECDLSGRNVLQSNGKSFSIYACYTYSYFKPESGETCTKKPTISNAPTNATTTRTAMMLAVQPATTPSNKAPLITQPLLTVILFGLSIPGLIQKHSAQKK